MRVFLGKHWFLLLLVVSLLFSWTFPEVTRPFLAPLPPQVVVALSLFLTSVALEGRHLYEAVRRPWAALWALLVSYAAAPFLAWLLVRLCAPADLGFGLVLMASVPCTLSSAVLWTRLAGGDEATALLAVLLSTGFSWLFTSLSLTLATASSIALPQSMMLGLLLVLVVPVAVGQASRQIPGLSATVKRHRMLHGVMVRLLILAIILKAALDLPRHVAQLHPLDLLRIAALCLAVHLGAFGVALWGGQVVGLSRGGRIAAAFAGSQKTLPVALYLFETYYRQSYPLAVVPLVLYHVGQLVIDTFLADLLARRPRPEVPPDETLDTERTS
jgi:sodium/bile acid cotransporter 7